MKRTLPLILLLFFLTGARVIPPGEIMLQESVTYRSEGRQLQEAGDLQRAAAAYRRAINIKPDYAEVYNDLGVVLENLGDLAQAEEAYETALKFQPDLGAAHSNLALLHEETQRVKEAAVHWGARVRLGPPQDPWVIAARAKLTQYQLAVPETAQDLAEKKSKEIRSAKIKAQEDQGRQVHELEAAKGRVGKEALEARRERAAQKAQAEKERAQIKQLKAAQARAAKQSKAARPVKPSKKPVVVKPVAPKTPTVAKPGDAERLSAETVAREIAREKYQVRGRAGDELSRRAAAAMRDGAYRDAVDLYRQILTLEPNNRSAKQGLERAQKALAKAA